MPLNLASAEANPEEALAKAAIKTVNVPELLKMLVVNCPFASWSTRSCFIVTVALAEMVPSAVARAVTSKMPELVMVLLATEPMPPVAWASCSIKVSAFLVLGAAKAWATPLVALAKA